MIGEADARCGGRRTRPTTRRRCRSPVIRTWSVASRRQDPTQRSAIAFIRGTPGRMGTTRVPTAVKTASKPLVKYPAVSLIRYRMSAVRVPSRLMRRVRAHWVAHAAVTCLVTPAMCTRRVPCSMKNRTNRRRRNTVSTWKTSTERTPWAWALRNRAQERSARWGAGSMSAGCRISQTGEAATFQPRLSSSPWIRRYPPSVVLPRQAQHQGAQRLGLGRTARTSARVGPLLRDQPRVPAQHGTRGDQQFQR